MNVGDSGVSSDLTHNFPAIRNLCTNYDIRHPIRWMTCSRHQRVSCVISRRDSRPFAGGRGLRLVVSAPMARRASARAAIRESTRSAVAVPADRSGQPTPSPGPPARGWGRYSHIHPSSNLGSMKSTRFRASLAEVRRSRRARSNRGHRRNAEHSVRVVSQALTRAFRLAAYIVQWSVIGNGRTYLGSQYEAGQRNVDHVLKRRALPDTRTSAAAEGP
jgi:hypothetical protein